MAWQARLQASGLGFKVCFKIEKDPHLFDMLLVFIHTLIHINILVYKCTVFPAALTEVITG
jgi:hypothetical protein